MVDPTDPNTWSVSGISVFSGRCVAFIYRVNAGRINASAFSTSIAVNPTATLNVGDNSTFVGAVKGQGSAPIASWSLLTADDNLPLGTQVYTCAHKDYQNGASGQTATCTISPVIDGVGTFAVFAP